MKFQYIANIKLIHLQEMTKIENHLCFYTDFTYSEHYQQFPRPSQVAVAWHFSLHFPCNPVLPSLPAEVVRCSHPVCASELLWARPSQLIDPGAQVCGSLLQEQTTLGVLAVADHSSGCCLPWWALQCPGPAERYRRLGKRAAGAGGWKWAERLERVREKHSRFGTKLLAVRVGKAVS